MTEGPLLPVAETVDDLRRDSFAGHPKKRGRSRDSGGGYFRNPWRKPLVLKTFTWLYLAWSILPLGVAILVSFTSGRSRAIFQPPLSLRWWVHDDLSVWHDPTLRSAIFHSLTLAILTVVIATPIGVAFALGLDRWRGRGSGTANFLILLSFVVPELILGVSLLILFQQLLTFVGLGTKAQVIGLATFQISYPVIIVRARLLSIGKEYEEAAMDLGASPTKAIRRVLMPMLYPAIFVSAILIFADVIDDFIIVRSLSLDAGTEPMSVKVYTAARGSAPPSVNAMATIMLLSTLIVIGLGAWIYKIVSKGQKGEGESVAQDFALQM